MVDFLTPLLGEGDASASVFSGGLALALVGAFVAFGWRVVSVSALAVWRLTVTTVSIDNRGPNFRHMSIWFERSGALARSRRFKVIHFSSAPSFLSPADTQETIFAPGEGRHWFFHDGAFGYVDMAMEKNARVETMFGVQTPLERLTVTLLIGGRKHIETWFDEGERLAGTRGGGPRAYVYDHQHEWRQRGSLRPRRADTVILEGEGDAAALIADAQRFLEAEDWYAARGVPWRRGYLLHGPPGTGKSSMIKVLASELDLSVATLDLCQRNLSDAQLCDAMADAPQRSILAIEDVDSVFVARRRAAEANTSVTFAGLLNAIDGLSSQEGRLVVMTTNAVQRLDPALIRPGRADIHMEFKLATSDQAERMFVRFFPGEKERAALYGQAMAAWEASPAAIQGHLLVHYDDPGEALASIDQAFAATPQSAAAQSAAAAAARADFAALGRRISDAPGRS